MKKLLKSTRVLNNGIAMPIIGLGTYRMENEQQAVDSIKYALEIGYRHIDTAEYYQNHKHIAKAIKESAVPRNEIFITSKIWNDYHDYDQTLEHFNQILEELETDYLDLCLVHWPTPKALSCYKALEYLYKEGKVRAIGVSNFTVEDLKDFLPKVNIKPTMNQVELNPSVPRLDVVNFCNESDIAVTSWQTIMKGQVADFELIQHLAKKYSITPAQVSLKWALQRGIIIIPKSVTPSRIYENQDLEKFELTDQEISQINLMTQDLNLNYQPVNPFKK
ncbi:aldo/keto reductase [Mesoplasma syrphidae]|uniref:Aldo/keto reductase n=1 Tax=Mesoplasma syrphidae TaxID=225999 RepID=A0A2K9BIZ7_9MOLU|nr:aldo/keto reductase [Mesoplasma syrphidae]AUF83276.1 aldo/keto reductase [Mesoplasma syrphidae]